MRVTMIGADYVRQVSGACFADAGHHVSCVEDDRKKIEASQRGVVPVVKPRLSDLVGDSLAKGQLVIGSKDACAREVMATVYDPLRLGDASISFTGRRAAELIRYAANAVLSAKVKFVNEIADLCEAVGAGVQEVARGIDPDGRIGPKVLRPDSTRRRAATRLGGIAGQAAGAGSGAFAPKELADVA